MVIILTLIGCATGKKFELDNSYKKTSLLYVYKPANAIGGKIANKHKITINGKVSKLLLSGGYVFLDLIDGTNKVEIFEQKYLSTNPEKKIFETTLDVQNKSEYFLKISSYSIGLTQAVRIGSKDISFIDKEKALPEISKMRLSKQ